MTAHSAPWTARRRFRDQWADALWHYANLLGIRRSSRRHVAQ